MTEPTAPTPTDVKRFVALQLAVTVVFAVFVVLAFGRDGEPGARWWAALALLALVFVAGAVVSRWWSEPQSLPADDPTPNQTAMRRLASHIARAFMVLEIPLVVCAVLGVSGLIGGLVMAAAVVPALAALAFGTWPTRRNVDRFADALERHGADSGLRQAFGR
ncbi:hypothetical protein [Aeromicrobium duanguangcaii]|uniref:Uncharacterized protein n=1 Tax=Aeromicrobium duanguangcaii TaxID=2968086 RepID=A0ABY5KDE2_9ACTN|nr:hypothetical protein [Aeromicrobium duanguangcaii]MCL3837425.1 hypothetical protein [Aeromicrobium duanguangcaii]UUI67451.1 hypothetical protein NP095_09545 [Aeromicrobium duanguangcaii]